METNRTISAHEEKVYRMISPLAEVGSFLKKMTRPQYTFTVKELLEAADLRDHSIPDGIDNLLTKKVSQVCRAGSRFTKNCICVELYDDGERSTKWAYEHGAILCITRKKYDGIPCVVVENPVEVYAKMCKKYRDLSQTKITTVVGSIGKTTTKRMIDAVYSTTYKTFSEPENENQIDCVGYICQHIPSGVTHLVQEVSEDTTGYVKYISRICSPEIAVITAIDKSHIEEHGSVDGIVEEIASIRDGMDNVSSSYIINMDDSIAYNHFNSEKAITVSLASEYADYCADEIDINNKGISFCVIEHRKKIPSRITLTGIYAEHNIISALQAFAAGRLSGISTEDIIKGLCTYRTVGKRQNVFRTKNGITVYADCYNAVAKSVQSAITASKQIPIDGERIAVLGDVEEAGDYSDQIHDEIIRSVSESGFSKVFLYGPKMENALQRWKCKDTEKYRHFSSKEELAIHLKQACKSGDLVLFKASRKSALEDVIKKVWPSEYKREMMAYYIPILKWRIKSIVC